METQFTPGPWKLNDRHTTIGGDDHGPNDQTPAIIGADNTFIATVEGSACYPRAAHRAPKESAQANARLIAAAPELLESLQAAVGYFEMFNVQGRLDGEYDKMLAAISKAIG